MEWSKFCPVVILFWEWKLTCVPCHVIVQIWYQLQVFMGNNLFGYLYFVHKFFCFFLWEMMVWLQLGYIVQILQKCQTCTNKTQATPVVCQGDCFRILWVVNIFHISNYFSLSNIFLVVQRGSSFPISSIIKNNSFKIEFVTPDQSLYD